MITGIPAPCVQCTLQEYFELLHALWTVQLSSHVLKHVLALLTPHTEALSPSWQTVGHPCRPYSMQLCIRHHGQPTAIRDATSMVCLQLMCPQWSV